MKIKHSKAILATIKTLYRTKGWNAVHGYLRFAKIKHEVELFEFGLSSNKKSLFDKVEWLIKSEQLVFKAHYANRGVRGKNGYHYNIVRGQQIRLLA